MATFAADRGGRLSTCVSTKELNSLLRILLSDDDVLAKEKALAEPSEPPESPGCAPDNERAKQPPLFGTLAKKAVAQ
jgi:hypothetical protein